MEFNKLTDKQFRRLSIMFALFAILYFICGVAKADTLKVAVIDTGFDTHSMWKGEGFAKMGLVAPKICPQGTFNTVDGSTDVKDNHGHGTHIAGLVAKGNASTDYCLVIIKYYDPKVIGADNMKASIKAYKKAIELKVDVINYSGGGTERSEEECNLMKQALDKGIKVFAAAGNERTDLDKTFSNGYYPAMCDKRITVVENVDKNGDPVPSSNYAKWAVKEQGTNVLSLLPNNQAGYMTGTSQATAIVTSKYLREQVKYVNECNQGKCVCSGK